LEGSAESAAFKSGSFRIASGTCGRRDGRATIRDAGGGQTTTELRAPRRRIRPRWALASAAAECRNARRIDSAGVRAAVKYLVPHETLGGIRGFRFLLHRRRGVGGGGHGERARPE
jgi:hypothetical protein